MPAALPGHFAVHLSARDSGQRLATLPPQALQGTPGGGSGPVLTVDSSRRFQAIEGFGGAFTEAAATAWGALQPGERHAALEDYFCPQRGHGYSLCRVHMNSCDFALGHYAHADRPGDVALDSFSIERDRQRLLPMIQAALAIAPQPLKLLVSPWSPPGWMKSNGQMQEGGRLLPQYADAWARCFVRFIQAYAEAGVPVWGVTVQNEPMAVQRWDSCIYSAEEERDFVRDHLGPTLERAGLSHVRIIVWDHNRDLLVQRASVMYGDPAAARYVWGCGFHWYGEDHFDQVQLVHDAWPDKGLLFTEGCQEGGPHAGSWAVGERYGRSLINDLNRWTQGWIDWNLMLDETGGPNHVGNLCSAPVLVDRASGTRQQQSAYAVLGHFARFVRPGARRILCASSLQAIECTAFVNEDGQHSVVAMNRTDAEQRSALLWDGLWGRLCLPPHSIATLVRAPVA
jgi:glucosylceramidase